MCDIVQDVEKKVFSIWHITPDLIKKIKAFDVKALNEVYFSNELYIKRLAYRVCWNSCRLSDFEDFFQEVYIVLPYCDFSNDKSLTKSLIKLCRKSVFSRSCLSLDKPLSHGKKADDKTETTFGDLIGVDGFKGTEFAEEKPVDTEENILKALSIIKEQKGLTAKQKDFLLSIALNVEYYSGIYAKEKI